MHSGMTASEDAIGLPLAPPAAAACISRSTASLSSTRPSAGRSCASPVAGSTTPGVAGVLTDRTPTALPVVGARAHGEGGWTAAAALVSSAMAANPTCSLSWGSLELN